MTWDAVPSTSTSPNSAERAVVVRDQLPGPRQGARVAVGRAGRGGEQGHDAAHDVDDGVRREHRRGVREDPGRPDRQDAHGQRQARDQRHRPDLRPPRTDAVLQVVLEVVQHGVPVHHVGHDEVAQHAAVAPLLEERALGVVDGEARR
jgi:hypothetical protein